MSMRFQSGLQAGEQGGVSQAFASGGALLRHYGTLAAALLFSALLAGCGDTPGDFSERAYKPLSPQLAALMQEKGVAPNAPVLIRAFKKEAEVQIWKMKPDGHYTLLKSYPICRWSGQLGPKTREGDRQVPEGFYTIGPSQMNPRSAYYLSFNVGYPNTYDRAHGYSGGEIMVHGVCSSAGCFSMTDQQIAEIYAIAREAFAGGQKAIQFQSFPFQMTAENFAKYRLDPNIAFWKELKVGYDNFEVTKQEVAVGVCNSHYVFNAAPANGGGFDPTGPCPPLKRDDAVALAVTAKEAADQAKVAALVASGVQAGAHRLCRRRPECAVLAAGRYRSFGRGQPSGGLVARRRRRAARQKRQEADTRAIGGGEKEGRDRRGRRREEGRRGACLCLCRAAAAATGAAAFRPAAMGPRAGTAHASPGAAGRDRSFAFGRCRASRSLCARRSLGRTASSAGAAGQLRPRKRRPFLWPTAAGAAGRTADGRGPSGRSVAVEFRRAAASSAKSGNGSLAIG